MKRFSILFLLLTGVMLSCSLQHSQAKHNITTCHCRECMDIKIGSMIMSGFRGVTASDEIKKAIKECHLGGVILFDKDVSNKMGERNIRSPKQVKELTAELQSYSKVPLMIAIDQEGGFVNRLKTNYGFPATVSAAYQGRKGSPDTATYWAQRTVATLQDCGINVNFVPCVDVNVNRKNPIIGKIERSFSSNADSVYLFAERWVRQHHRGRIITSIKHFPGHGSSLNDSHLGLTDITHTWSETELKPYKKFIDHGYRGIVMVGHLINKNIDPEYPASLSEKTLTGLLRKKLKFDGVIATDDINMGAIVDHFSLKKAISLAINGGVNMIIAGNNGKVYEAGLPERCYRLIQEMVASGEIPIEKIDDSYRRLSKLKTSIWKGK